MPSEAAHLAAAVRNQAALDHLATRMPEFGGWVTTTAFYKALHLVEATFAADPKIGHTANHGVRESTLKQHVRYKHIYKFYRMLEIASQVARHLSDSSTNPPRDVPDFATYLSPERVRSEVLGHWLRQIETSIGKLLPGRWPPKTE